jgi:hypothetical protein
MCKIDYKVMMLTSLLKQLFLQMNSLFNVRNSPFRLFREL